MKAITAKYLLQAIVTVAVNEETVVVFKVVIDVCRTRILCSSYDIQNKKNIFKYNFAHDNFLPFRVK